MVEWYTDLPPIWEEVAQVEGCTGGLVTLNQILFRGLQSCWRVLGGREHFSTFLPLLAFVNNVSLMNPYMDQDHAGEGFTYLMGSQGTVEASTCRGWDASLIAYHMDTRLAFVDFLWTATWVTLSVILSMDEAIHDLGTFTFVVVPFLSVGGETHTSSRGVPQYH